MSGVSCPRCGKEVQQEFGIVTCPHCAHVFMLSLDGAPTSMERPAGADLQHDESPALRESEISGESASDLPENSGDAEPVMQAVDEKPQATGGFEASSPADFSEPSAHSQRDLSESELPAVNEEPDLQSAIKDIQDFGNGADIIGLVVPIGPEHRDIIEGQPHIGV